MKKIYFLFTILIISLSSKAQLTLTKAANAPVVGTIDMNTYYDSSTVVPKTTGLNKNWNFTSLVNSVSGSSVTYMNASSTPSANQCPGSNIATYDGASYYVYYNSQTNNMDYTGGVDVSSNDITNFTDPITWMVWPFTYGTSNNDVFAGTETYSTSTVNYTGNMNISGTGAGTVTLPGGQKYTNCLQITRTYTYIVSGAQTLTFSAREYEYWTSSYKTPIINLSYVTIKQPTITTKDFGVTVNALADVGIEEHELDNNTLVIYPNPVKDKINVLLKGNAVAEEIELYDVTGKLVLSEKNTNTLSTSTVNKGVYLLKINSKNEVMQKQVIITE